MDERKLAKSFISETALIGMYILRIRSNTNVITPNIYSFVTVVDTARREHIKNMSVGDSTKRTRNPAHENLCVVTSGTKLLSVSRTVMRAKPSCGNIQLARTHMDLVLKRLSLDAQRILNTTLEVLFLVKIANPSPSSTTLLNDMMVASYVASPQLQFVCESIAGRHDNFNAL